MATYTNTRDVLGDQGTLDALIEHSLTSFTDDGVKTLRTNAFYRQEQLEEVCLPNLTEISKSGVFDYCYRLLKIKIALNLANVIRLTMSGVFSHGCRAIIYVPDDLVASYKAKYPWSQESIASRIYGISEEGGPQDWSDTEISDTWEQIAAKVSAGTAADSYKYGQYKTIDLGSEGVIRFQIVDKNKDELSDGTGTAQLTWVAMEALLTSRRFNPESDGSVGTGAIGGWKESELRSAIQGDLLQLFPQSVRNAIKSVKKYSVSFDENITRTANELTNDTLWIPSLGEILGGGNYETSGPRYTRAFGNALFKFRNKYASDSPIDYFFRTANSSANFQTHTASGSISYRPAQQEWAVVLGFCT